MIGINADGGPQLEIENQVGLPDDLYQRDC
jgi:hypothetical protein